MQRPPQLPPSLCSHVRNAPTITFAVAPNGLVNSFPGIFEAVNFILISTNIEGRLVLVKCPAWEYFDFRNVLGPVAISILLTAHGECGFDSCPSACRTQHEDSPHWVKF
nr:unnamed protein product [Spirometra erinaceieuropaei]